jgi:hypothetical protein
MKEGVKVHDDSAGHDRQAAGLSAPCYSGAGHDGGSSLVMWRGLCLCKGLESGCIVIGKVISYGVDFETD